MKMEPGTPLSISLRWSGEDIQPVGRLAYRDHVAFLEYDRSFLKAGLDLSPLHHRTAAGLHRPHDIGVFEGLHGLFHDSLPDGWGRLLVDCRARQLGIDPASLSPLDRLACVGSSGMGALVYEPETPIWPDDDAGIDLDKLAEDAKRVLSGETAEVLAALGKAGGSPGGARPKALIAVNENGEALHGVIDPPEGYDHYLVKFRGNDDPDDIANIEMAYALMAKTAGIDMPETRLLEGAKGQAYFAAKRFDRNDNHRLHVHSASGLLYADIRIPSLDYRELIRLTRAVTRDQRDCAAMFTLAVFNVLSHNRDDHGRQFSYLMDRDGTWRLAPAYDLTFAPGPGGEHSTSVLGHGKDITRAHLLELGKSADLKERDANDIIDHVAATTSDWTQFADEAGVSRQSNAMIAADLKKTRV